VKRRVSFVGGAVDVGVATLSACKKASNGGKVLFSHSIVKSSVTLTVRHIGIGSLLEEKVHLKGKRTKGDMDQTACLQGGTMHTTAS
jgi:hypothetical protein